MVTDGRHNGLIKRSELSTTTREVNDDEEDSVRDEGSSSGLGQRIQCPKTPEPEILVSDSAERWMGSDA